MMAKRKQTDPASQLDAISTRLRELRMGLRINQPLDAAEARTDALRIRDDAQEFLNLWSQREALKLQMEVAALRAQQTNSQAS